jgi:hypothetical protein
MIDIDEIIGQKIMLYMGRPQNWAVGELKQYEERRKIKENHYEFKSVIGFYQIVAPFFCFNFRDSDIQDIQKLKDDPDYLYHYEVYIKLPELY